MKTKTDLLMVFDSSQTVFSFISIKTDFIYKQLPVFADAVLVKMVCCARVLTVSY
jgi:hypothetical protein